ncbi:MAG: ABC transporter permease [Bacteroidota bacterium]|nr:ABC transporter permease [Bacteroidota bacterium]MDP4231354.1 ABC transporter permease [Bacteroidota bacterium]MDP4236527.1 ABC transporter permease [Bacteroidota bacterium]
MNNTTSMSSLDYPQPMERSAVFWIVRDTYVLIVRSLRHIFKNLDQLMALVIQPIMFMLLFRYVFGGAINTGSTTYVNYLVAGILIQMAAFGAMTTSLNVAADLQRGIIDRLKSLPIASSAVMTGHVVADLVRNVLSSIILIAISLLVGFSPTASIQDWLLITAILLLFTLAFSWLAAIIGLLARTVEAVQWISFVLVFPLTFASSAFVPTKGMPEVLRIFAENQPVTHVIEAMRSLMVGTPMNDHALLSAIWCIGITVICVPIASYLFRKHSTK